MIDFLRGLGVGIVNLLGVAVPGALLLGLAAFGLALPSLVLALNLTGVAVPAPQTWPKEIEWAALAGFAGLSYVAGYILRLNSPNDLDRSSVERRHRRKMMPSRVGFPKGRNDHFPYLGLSEYVGKLKTSYALASLVVWDEKNTESCDTTHVNMWKKDIELFCPELAAGVRSEEAHVRLMSGVWLAIKTAWWLVLAGLLLASGVLTVSRLAVAARWPLSLVENVAFFAAYAVFALFLLAVMFWARVSIEKLFHPRRVGELLLVLHAKLHADRIAGSSTKGAKELNALVSDKEVGNDRTVSVV
jgi:hypothetical protein